MALIVITEEVFILRSLEIEDTALPHGATWGSTRVSLEAEGIRSKDGQKAFIMVSVGRNG